MGAEQALSHFRRRGHKAVITGGDRSDVQLAGRLFGKIRFAEEEKLRRFGEMVEARLDFERLYAALGLG